MWLAKALPRLGCPWVHIWALLQAHWSEWPDKSLRCPKWKVAVGEGMPQSSYWVQFELGYHEQQGTTAVCLCLSPFGFGLLIKSRLSMHICVCVCVWEFFLCHIDTGLCMCFYICPGVHLHLNGCVFWRWRMGIGVEKMHQISGTSANRQMQSTHTRPHTLSTSPSDRFMLKPKHLRESWEGVCFCMRIVR